MMHLFVSSHVLSLIINYHSDRSNQLLTEEVVLAVESNTTLLLDFQATLSTQCTAA